MSERADKARLDQVVNAQKEADALEDRRELESDLAWLLDDARGRRLLRYIRRCARMDAPQVIEGESLFAYCAGRRESGLKFVEACRAVSSVKVVEAEMEEARRFDERSAELVRLARIHKQKKGGV